MTGLWKEPRVGGPAGRGDFSLPGVRSKLKHRRSFQKRFHFAVLLLILIVNASLIRSAAFLDSSMQQPQNMVNLHSLKALPLSTMWTDVVTIVVVPFGISNTKLPWGSATFLLEQRIGHLPHRLGSVPGSLLPSTWEPLSACEECFGATDLHGRSPRLRGCGAQRCG